MSYHEVREPKFVACDECGCAVSTSERDRTLHADWHDARDAVIRKQVIDLTMEHARRAVAELRAS